MNMSVSNPRIAIVAAISRKDRAIGNGGKLLWHIPEDMRRFKALTMGHPVIMGRKTFESIVSYRGGPLPGRTNIVVTRNPEYAHEGASVVGSLEEGLALARTHDTEEIHIGGGSELYAQALPLVDRLYLTLIDDVQEADSFFPEYTEEFTTQMSSEKHQTSAGLTYEWRTLERK